ncbi:NAD(P)-dependent alcohol dehydrogenase [bacterium]|nr:NAD(P)-dependent alcohol dehydrogenase [bacterium]
MCELNNAEQSVGSSRRRFLRQSGLLGAGLLLAGPLRALDMRNDTPAPSGNIKSRGYAARDSSGVLSPWEFERRPLGEDDVLVDIKYVGICHSDIHQLRGDWGPEQYPQVPGHEIAGIVAAVGRKVTRFEVGDRVGVGCMVDSCGTCHSCRNGEEHHCDRYGTVFTYGAPYQKSPTGITQGGYSNNIIVKEHFVLKIPDSMRLQDAAPLLCAGITTYSPIMRASIKPGDKVGVAGIGGLGHMAVKLAISKGAEVHAFTTTEDKLKDILAFGAKEAVYVDSLQRLAYHYKSVDYMISTIPVDYDVGTYSSVVRPYGSYTQVGVPKAGTLTVNHFAFVWNRVNFNGSAIGGVPETQEVLDYCAKHRIYPDIQLINAEEANDAWAKVVNKEARYRYVIDATTI